jgi:putative NADH-flavin reductase
VPSCEYEFLIVSLHPETRNKYYFKERIMANVLLIGATGFVGSAVLNELVSRGNKVTTVVRNIEKLAKSDLVNAVKEDVANVDAIAKLAEGKDAIISAYNPGWTNPDIATLITENYPKILEAAKKSGVERLLIVGGAGTLFCAPGLRVVDSGAIPEEIMGGVRPLGDFYLNTLMNENDIDWVFFSPAGVFDQEGKKTGNYRLGKDDLIVDAEGNSHISVQDYADAMVNELEKPAHHKERFTIGY